VQIAGVLLVFCYLVAPSIFAIMFFDELRPRLLTGWTMATLVSAVGLYFSYDRPSGPTIMVGFAMALLVGALVRAVMPAARPARALSATAAVMLAIAGASWAMQTRWLEPESAAAVLDTEPAASVATAAPEHAMGSSVDDLREAMHDAHPNVRARAVAELGATGDPRVLHELTDALHDKDAGVREAAAIALGRAGNRTVLPALRQQLDDAHEDEWVRLRLAASMAALGDEAALPALLKLATGADAGLTRLEALNILSRLAALPDPPLDAPDTDAARARLDAVKTWYGDGARLRWDPKSGRFLRR
jgi:hypothetical protein